MIDWKQSVLGRTGRTVGRLGLSAGYGADRRCVEIAAERGVDYFYWGSFRNTSFGAGLQALRSRPDSFLLAIQSYTRVASLLPWSLERALRYLHMDYADILLLGMWNKPVPPAIYDRALRLRERGLIRYLAVSSHNRRFAAELAADSNVDILHVRYNAVHPGTEQDIFPKLNEMAARPGVVSFTATSWRELLQPEKVTKTMKLNNISPEKTPTAGDCYRFVLTNSAVDVCVTGPRSATELTAALDAWDEGPLSTEEMEWMRRVGKAKYRKPAWYSMRG